MEKLYRFYSVSHNHMIMVEAMDINSRIIVFYGYNVCFYGSLCDTHDWLVLRRLKYKSEPYSCRKYKWGIT